MSIFESILDIRNKFDIDIQNSDDNSASIESIRNKYLSRKGTVAGLFSQMGSIDASQRPEAGKSLNELKSYITASINKRLESFNGQSDEDSEYSDLTLPGDPFPGGSLHPITLVLDEINSIFSKLGFSVAYGPEVDTDYYNFEALNIPKHHPARDMQDTFYISDHVVLRTHTSNNQIHTMENHAPPIKIIAPGRVYRNEDVSVRSYCLFHQVEGLYVDKNVSMADLKGVLNHFAREFFGQKVKTRFRPSFFPFTEPSAEMDVSCFFCQQKGCNICKYSGWLEILGCGMVDPEVFKSVGYDPEVWSGYAFGMGIERMAMQRYGIEDIRLLFEGDIRFLRQF